MEATTNLELIVGGGMVDPLPAWQGSFSLMVGILRGMRNSKFTPPFVMSHF
jgi:hypothetical protein